MTAPHHGHDHDHHRTNDEPDLPLFPTRIKLALWGIGLVFLVTIAMMMAMVTS